MAGQDQSDTFINSQKEIFWPFISAIISSDILSTHTKNSFISLSLILGTCNSQTTTTKFDVLERSNSIVLVDVIESDNSYSTDLAKEVMMDVEKILDELWLKSFHLISIGWVDCSWAKF